MPYVTHSWRRLFGVSGAGLLLLVLTRPALPQATKAAGDKVPAEVPPYERQLTGEDARRVAELDKKIEELREVGKLSEAQAAARTILEVRRRVQGAEHWQTGDAQRLLRTLEQIAALPADALRELSQAANGRGEASKLEWQGHHAEATPLLRRELEVYRRHLGEAHPYTANAYLSLAFHLHHQGKYGEAEALHHKALAICRQALGEAHPNTALSYGGLALSLNSQGKYGEAGPLCQKALAILRHARGEAHPDTAASYDNLAWNLSAQGKYGEADPVYQKALAICRQTLGEAHLDTAHCYNNLAANLHGQSKYAEAEPLLRKAMAIRRAALGEAHRQLALSYNNLAANLDVQGKRAEAEALYQKALAICRQTLGEAHPLTAQTYNNLAANLGDQGKYGEAELLYHKALAIRRQALGEAHPNTAETYSHLAHSLRAHSKYGEAEPLDQTALVIRRQALGEAHKHTASSYSSLAANLNAQGKYQEAQELWTQASRVFALARLRSTALGLERAYFAPESSPLLPLTCSLARAGKAKEAWQFLELSLARGLLDEVSAGRLQPLGHDERKRVETLSARLDQLDKQIAALVTAKEQTETGGRKLQGLLQQRRKAETELTEIDAAQSARAVYGVDRIQGQLPANAALVAWVDVKGETKAADPNGEHWACVLRRKGQPVWVKLPGSGAKGAWTEEDDDQPRQLQLALAVPAGEYKGDRQKVISRLAAQRLAPLEPTLRGDSDNPPVHHLLVEPAWWMAGIPVEALTDRYTISYVPSGTLFARLREQRPAKPPARPRLLAVGDPVFTRPDPSRPPEGPLPENGLLLARVAPGSNAARSGIQPGDVLLSYLGTKLSTLDDLKAALGQQREAKPGEQSGVPVEVWRDGKMLSLHVRPGPLGIQTSPRPAKEELLAKRDGDRAVRASRGGAWTALPGSRREVEALARLFERPLTLLGSEASAQRLDQLAAAGELKRFRYLHFATHGDVNPRIALESAVILAQDQLPDPVDQLLAGKHPYDGRLTAAEMRRWQLDAELVTLSACETGLGQRAGGEGYLGFAQALFLAGARSVVLSLWKVDDTATALLMTRFYQNLLGKREGLDKPLPKAVALREAKQWLRTRTVEEVSREVARLPVGVRGPVREMPRPAQGVSVHPFADPYYWSAFILLGDPD
jgi:hypothetical protein